MLTPNIGSFLARVICICLLATSIASAATAELQQTLTKNATLKGGVRIIGGVPITIDKAPFLVQIKDSFLNFFCGGTLVTPLYVVTAAHCLVRYHPRELRIIGGQTLLEGSGGVERQAEKFMLPKGYVSPSVHMDVAVIKLFKEMKGHNIRPISMCNEPVPDKGVVQVSGWGRTKEDAETSSNSLQYIQIPKISSDKCTAQLEDSITKLTWSMICAGDDSVKDACTGDSGGPGVHGGKLCAIVSWGVGCGRQGRAGIYTSIPAVRPFIDAAMKL